MSFWKWIARFKNFQGRAGSWMTIINFFMIFLVFKNQYKIPLYAWQVVVFGTLGFLVVGWFDYKFIMPHQIEHQNDKNDMMHAIKRIEDKLK